MPTRRNRTSKLDASNSGDRDAADELVMLPELAKAIEGALDAAAHGEHLPSPFREMHELRYGVSLGLRFRQARARAAARAILFAVLEAVRLPTDERERWLGEALAALRRTLSKSERRALVVQAVRARDADQARDLLLRADEAFDRLSDAHVAKLLEQLAENPRGATHRGEHSIAAELSIDAGAFGDCRRDRERRDQAIERVSKAFRKAATANAQPKGTRQEV